MHPQVFTLRILKTRKNNKKQVLHSHFELVMLSVIISLCKPLTYKCLYMHISLSKVSFIWHSTYCISLCIYTLRVCVCGCESACMIKVLSLESYHISSIGLGKCLLPIRSQTTATANIENRLQASLGLYKLIDFCRQCDTLDWMTIREMCAFRLVNVIPSNGMGIRRWKYRFELTGRR